MKLSFAEIQIGQKLITIFNEKNVHTDCNNEIMYTWCLLSYTRFYQYIEKDIILTVVEKDIKNKNIVLQFDTDANILDEKLNVKYVVKAGTKFSPYLTDMRSFTIEYGDVIKGADIKQYKVFLDGKQYKPKYYADLGKIKAGLRFMFDINDGYIEDKYIELNPELYNYEKPDYLGYGDRISEEQIKNLTVVEYTNKKNPTVLDFNVYDYYRELKTLSTVTRRFGAAAREVYRTALQTKEYSYIFVYIPDNYKQGVYFNYSSLRESDVIKTIIKDSGITNFKKSTKHGKTAIAVQELNDLDYLISKTKKKIV